MQQTNLRRQKSGQHQSRQRFLPIVGKNQSQAGKNQRQIHRPYRQAQEPQKHHARRF